MNADPLMVNDLTISYGPGLPVIECLSLPPLAPGAITALVGPNGAGKSTLLRGMAGLRRSHGAVRLGGIDLLALPTVRRAALVTYMPQALPLSVTFTVFESLIAALRIDIQFSGHRARQRAATMLERLGILHLASVPLNRLSGGQKQLASLAQALVREPRVLLLDEPTSALDLNFQLRVMDLVAEIARERGTVVVAVLHDLGLACRFADTIVVLHGGRAVAAGAPADVLTPSILRDVYAVEASLHHDPTGHLQVVVKGRVDVIASAASCTPFRENHV